ncbi:MAG: hypothetical protein JW727_06155 [Candidatus Aenigmarchaeota archaeon]|nr:hypothetical protein [Candidatus Aenigmarchaeota archaeon]
MVCTEKERELAEKFLALVERTDIEPDGVCASIIMELRKCKKLNQEMKRIREMAEEVASLWIPYDEENREKAKGLFMELTDKLVKIADKT